MLNISKSAIKTQWEGLSEHTNREEFARYALKRAGRVFCLSGWQLKPGDVFLTKNAVRPSKGSHYIAAYQALFHQPHQSQWTHVSIYEGDGIIWDAMPNQHIRKITVTQLMRECSHLEVFRLVVPQISANRLQDGLIKFSEDSYHFDVDLRARLLDRVRYFVDNDYRGVLPSEKVVVCSTWVQKVLRYASQTGVLADVYVPIPSDFAAHGDFAPVQLTLRK